jgi:putative chitinase
MPNRNEIAMLNAAREAGITSRDELANFMGQLGHESGGFATLEEGFRYARGIDQIPVESAFREGRTALEAARVEALAGRPQELARLMYGGRMGNDDAGDGYLYRGRGFIMLTGEENYRTRGDAVGLDLVRNPDLAADRDNASRIAVSYWRDRIPEADRDDVSAATQAINGGEIGLPDRYNRFDAWYAQLTPEFMADLAAGRVQPGEGVAPAVGLAANADGILRRGEAGAEVTQLRTDLHSLGIRDGRNRELPVEGNFNASVEQAVRRFQEQQGLAINGRAGPETLDAIRTALELQRQQRPAQPNSPEAGAGNGQPNVVPPIDTPERRRMIEGDQGPNNAIPARPAPDAIPLNSSVSSRMEGAQTDDPRNPGHPAHALDRRVRDEVAKAETAIGKPWDNDSERLTASLFGLAREKGFSADDNLKVGFNRPTATYGAGELVFVYREGGNTSPDPYANRAQMATSAALSQPVDETYRRIGLEAQAQQQTQALAQQASVSEEQKNPTRSV